MTIPIRFMTAVFKKSAIENGYPGGLSRFLEDQLCAAEDDHLVGVCFMSGGELQRFLDVLRSIGVDLANGCAVADMVLGALEPCEGIQVTSLGDELFDGWQATFSGVTSPW